MLSPGLRGSFGIFLLSLSFYLFPSISDGFVLFSDGGGNFITNIRQEGTLSFDLDFFVGNSSPCSFNMEKELQEKGSLTFPNFKKELVSRKSLSP